jgi:hypothetical protein
LPSFLTRHEEEVESDSPATRKKIPKLQNGENKIQTWLFLHTIHFSGSTQRNTTQRDTLLSTMPAICRISSLCQVLAVVCVFAVLPELTHSFGCLPTTTAGRGKGGSQLHLLPESSARISACPQKIPSPSSLSVFPKKKNDEGGEKRQTPEEQQGATGGLLDEKNLPGLVFTTVLTLWHFWIGPALRPIILDMQQ